MHMDVVAAEEVRVDPQLVRVRAHVAEGGLRRLFHHVAELPGEGERAPARHRRGLDKHHVAAHRRPGQPVATPGMAVRSAISSCSKRGTPR